MAEFKLKSEYITLGQLLKVVGLISSGGMAKQFLEDSEITLNGESENRRGKKLFKGDLLVINGFVYKIVWLRVYI